jgi:hypothetical protein
VSNTQQQLEDLNRELWLRIAQRAKDAERDPDDVVSEIVETSEEPFMFKDEKGRERGWTQERRLQQAMSIVASRLEVAALTRAEPYILFVQDVLPVRQFQTKNGMKKLGAIYGFASKINDKGETGPAQFAHVQFWDDDSDKVNDAKPDQAYQVRLGGSFKEGHLQLRGEAKTRWDKPVEVQIDALEILKASFRQVALADLEQYTASKVPVLVRGNVTFSRTGRSKTGKDFGILTIWDQSQKTGDRGVTVFVDPVQVRYGKGSDVWILGTPSKGGKNEETGEQYGPSLNSLVIISEFTVPLAVKPNTQESSNGAVISKETPAVDFSDFGKEATPAPAAPPAPSQGE